ncbi:Fibronectin type III domain protein [Bifidobacterium longum subsp. infantis]|uniref:Fibronectin type III domain protein n=1 Tax=Bifidobacterium longum subsp. infantis TaxID=1682 RepID=A0A8U0LI05_BIFLI|nr:fibronectin type III domain-containing protein [Bifidobacterium longum]VWQ38454.1 Fibronectin type III domain protein [Bifidobacterium longum subsp. infantis]
MIKTLHARLVAYLPNGGRLGNLPAPLSWDASVVNNDLGALKVTYSRRAIGGGILKRGLEQGLEIGLEVSDGGAWKEPYNCRYLLIGRSRNAEDVSDTVTLTCQSMGWLANKILNNDTSHLIQDGDNKGKRAFLSKNPGTIIRTILDENKARKGAGLVLAPGFDTGKDAAGANWKSVYTLYYSLGTSLNSMLSSMVGGGAIDWRTEGRTLRIWNADSTSLSRDLSGRVHISMAHDILEAPEEESIEDLSSDILVEGDNGLIFRESNPAAPTPWGGWESYVSQGGVSDEATAKAFMQTTLASSARVRGQYTRSLLVTNAESLPLVDYRPGDWITAPTVQHGEKVRIQQVTVSLDSNGLKASITLNDKVYDSQVRAAKKIAGITGGAQLAGSEGGRPAPEKDHRVPNAPTGLVVQTDAYISSRGTALGLATLQWAAVSQATDDTAIDISGYRVEYRKSTAGAPWVSGGVTDAQRLTLGIGGLECGQRYEFRVRAVPTYSDRLGDWSNVVVALVASDVTPPSIPSKPILTSKLGVVDVQWDGRNTAGGGMELDFDHVEVGISDSNGNWKYRDSVARDGYCHVTGLELNSTWWFALRSVDHSGNKSAWSAGASVKVAPVLTQEDLNKSAEQILAAAKNDAAQQVAVVDKKLTETGARIEANKEAQDKADAAIRADVSKNAQAITDNKNAQASVDKAQDAATKKVSDDLAAANKTINANKAATDKALAEAEKKAQDAYDNAVNAQKTADGMHSIFKGPDDPRNDKSNTVRAGDFWFVTQKYWTRWLGEANNSTSLLADFYTYWEGAANDSASVLVPLSSRVTAVRQFDGTQWNEFNLVASNIIATGSITAQLVDAEFFHGRTIVGGTYRTEGGNVTITDSGIIFSYRNRHLLSFASDSSGKWQLTMDAPIVSDASMSAPTITGGTITSAVYRTANGGLTINDAGIVLKNASGTSTLAADSATGSVTLVGTVKASQVTGSTITTTNGRMLWNDAGLVLKDANGSITLYASSMDGSVTMKGSLTSGSTLSGVTVTGSIIQTTGAANRGVKLTSGGLVGYDSSGNAKFALDTNGNLKMDGGILANGTLTAPTVNAGVMTSTVINAPVVQSSTADNTGWKLRGNALDMWDSRRNQTVHLDGEGANNLLTGTFQTGLSGSRVMISPSFRQYEVGGPDKLEGAGIQFFHGTNAYMHPYIAVESTTQQEGEVSALTFNGGHRAEHDPGAFARIGERKGSDNTTKGGTVFLAADQDYDSPDTGKKRAYLTLWSPKTGDTTATLAAQDPNGRVGIQADIDSGCLYLGGFLGQFGAGRGTFQTVYFRNGIMSGEQWVTQTCTYAYPAKYGLYHAHVSSDSMGSIMVGSNNDSASGCGLWVRGVGNGVNIPYGSQILAILARQ